MIFVILTSLLSSLYFYVASFTAGMNAKKWAVAGLALGPVLLPLFNISRHIQWRKSVGYNNLFIQA